MKCCDTNKKTDDEKNLPGILGCRERVPSTFDIAWQVSLIVFQLLEDNANFRGKFHNGDLILNHPFFLHL